MGAESLGTVSRAVRQTKESWRLLRQLSLEKIANWDENKPYSSCNGSRGSSTICLQLLNNLSSSRGRSFESKGTDPSRADSETQHPYPSSKKPQSRQLGDPLDWESVSTVRTRA